MKNIILKEVLKTRDGVETMEVIYGSTNKLFSYKPNNATPKVSVFVGDCCGIILTEENKIDVYVVDYNDGAYVFNGVVDYSENENFEDFLKRESIKIFNKRCKRSEQIVDEKYVKKSLFGLKYL